MTQLRDVAMDVVVHDDLLTLVPGTYSCYIHGLTLADGEQCTASLLVPHNIVPLGWTRAVGLPATTWVPVCPDQHYALHLLIRQLVEGSLQTQTAYNERAFRLAMTALEFWEAYEHRLATAPGVDLIRRYADAVVEPPLKPKPLWRRLLGT